MGRTGQDLTREQRLAAKLRGNLLLRKAQAREIGSRAGEGGAGNEGGEPSLSKDEGER